MNPLDLIYKFRSTLPTVREWIERTLEENEKQAITVSNLTFPRLKKAFPSEALNKAKSVVVPGKVPFPPLSRMGLLEFAEMESMSLAGITYKDTFFISHLHQTESLYFHEMVHVIQWERLGVDDFLLAYGMGLAQFGYRNCSLEQMACSLQESFDHGSLPAGVIELIRRQTDAIWAGVASLISKA